MDEERDEGREEERDPHARALAECCLCMGVVIGSLLRAEVRRRLAASVQEGGLHRHYLALLHDQLGQILRATAAPRERAGGGAKKSP